MNSHEKKKAENLLASTGATQSSYNPNKWTNGSQSYTFTGSNTMVNNGSYSHGYSNIKDHINKKS